MQQDYFSHFGLEPSFDIDLKALGKAYRARQQESHPDRHIQSDSHTRLKAVTQTAFNTEAYHTLKSSVKRGVYLLQQNGIDFSLENYTVSDMQLLMQQLKYREQLSDIIENNDENLLLDLADEANHHAKQLITELNSLFEGDMAQSSTLIQAKLCELQFFDKLKTECDEAEEQLLMS